MKLNPNNIIDNESRVKHSIKSKGQYCIYDGTTLTVTLHNPINDRQRYGFIKFNKQTEVYHNGELIHKGELAMAKLEKKASVAEKKVAKKVPSKKVVEEVSGRGRKKSTGPTIGSVVMALFRKKKGNPTFEECLEAAQNVREDTKYDKKHHAYYKMMWKKEQNA